MRVLLDVLKLAVSAEASDVHLTVGLPPCLRMGGKVRRVEGPELGTSELEEIASSLLIQKQAEELRERARPTSPVPSTGSDGFGSTSTAREGCRPSPFESSPR